MPKPNNEIKDNLAGIGLLLLIAVVMVMVIFELPIRCGQ